MNTFEKLKNIENALTHLCETFDRLLRGKGVSSKFIGSGIHTAKSILYELEKISLEIKNEETDIEETNHVNKEDSINCYGLKQCLEVIEKRSTIGCFTSIRNFKNALKVIKKIKTLESDVDMIVIYNTLFSHTEPKFNGVKLRKVAACFDLTYSCITDKATAIYINILLHKPFDFENILMANLCMNCILQNELDYFVYIPSGDLSNFAANLYPHDEIICTCLVTLYICLNKIGDKVVK